MADKLLISVSASQVSAARWAGGRFARSHMFANNEDGLAGFKDYIAHISHLPVHMLVDAVEEDYRFELLPHSFGADRSEMVNRKLKQHYRNTPYCSARPQGRDSGKRRDDRYLFCALTNPELVTSWVQAVIERELPIAGIYLLPTVSHGLVEKLQLKQANLLMVSIHSSGMRLTYFRDQKLRISRLARIDSTGPQAIKSYAEEISNTRLYLHALRIMTLDEQLSVLVIDRDDSLTELADAIARDNPNIECRRLGRPEIVASLGISAPALDSSADAFYLQLLGLHAPDSNLAPANITSGYRQHQARHAFYALAGVTAFAAAAWCTFTLYQIIDTRFDTTAATRQTAQLQAQYQEETRRFPAAPTSAENLKRAVEISQKIGSTTRSPEAMMDIVGQALDSNPAIILKTFGWKYGPAAEIEAEPGKASKPMGNSGAPAPAAGSRRQSGLVDGEVRPFRGDYRDAIETIDRFAETLLKQPQVAEVKILKLPLNINPGLTLSGNTTDSREQAGRAEFKLVLVLKQPL
jgi:hypothetical protein